MKLIKMYDVVIIGSGGAGLSAAIEAKKNGSNVLVVSKTYPTHSQTSQAQGGINAVLSESEEDNNKKFIEDTYKASYNLGNISHIKKFCESSKNTIEWLDSIGVPFSRDQNSEISQRKFGGTKAIRTCYSSDYTGLKILHTLYDQCIKYDIEFLNEHYLLDLIIEENSIKGVIVLDILDSSIKEIKSKSVILATGGYAGIYHDHTTNSFSNTGDGVAIALKSGAKISNIEFVQFHPTALENRNILISESARAEGAYLIDEKGNRFIDELKSRDIVARAIFEKIQEGHKVFIDARHLGKDKIESCMPQERRIIHDFMKLKMERDLIPITPSSHYSMGGILTNIEGESSIKNLYACGECAQSGIHGANRLGGNSLMEIIQFGREIGLIASKNSKKTKDIKLISNETLNKNQDLINTLFKNCKYENINKIKKEIGKELFKNVGLFKDENGLKNSIEEIQKIEKIVEKAGLKNRDKIYNKSLIELLELKNIITLSKTIILSSLLRKESRGAHYRRDYKERSNIYDKNTIVELKENNLEIYFEDIK